MTAESDHVRRDVALDETGRARRAAVIERMRRDVDVAAGGVPR